ncbi:DUF3488 and DUF4129 domain-containing transglutaminase family protein [Chloroflexota bacterium]
MQIAKYSASSRFLAFLAASCSIAAVAWVNRDPLLLTIGILGVAAGYFYSWHRRNTVSRRRTLVLIIIVILLVVSSGEEIVMSGVSDRLLLSRYLVYGLVLGSFDLMRVRNVMASLILGALLLVLISELALTLWFMVYVAVFTVLALTAVAVGRIESEEGRAVLVGEFKWLTAGKFWLGFIVSTLLLSTVFFMFMPRIASSQVAQAAWLPSRLDLSLGGPTMLPSRPGVLVSPGIFPSRQNGEIVDDSGYATLGYVGSLADRAVMHVRSQISSYWRGATLDKYDGRGWLPSSSQIELHNENRDEFVLPDSKVGMSGEKVYWQAYYLLSDQPNAVFTGYNPGRIYLPRAGQILLERGTLYRVLSVVPYYRQELLRSDSVVSEDFAHLMLPLVSKRTTILAESVVQGASTDYDKAVRLESFLLSNYSYDLNVEPLPPGRDAVDYFLFEQQTGYCSQFATTMAVMARQVDLPARVAIGYMPGFIDPLTGAHIVRVGDAHAWVEVHFRQYGWVAFDPTPRTEVAMGFATGRNWISFGLEGFTGVTFASILSPLAGNFSLGSFSLPGWLWVVLLAVGIAITVAAILITPRKVKKRQEVNRYSVLSGESRRIMLNLYRAMVTLLVKKGLPSRKPYQPPDEYAAIVSAQIPKDREIIEWLSQVASSAAYDHKHFNPLTVQEARRKLADLRRTLASNK